MVYSKQLKSDKDVDSTERLGKIYGQIIRPSIDQKLSFVGSRGLTKFYYSPRNHSSLFSYTSIKQIIIIIN